MTWSWTLSTSTDAIAFWVLCSVGSLPKNPGFDPFEDDCGEQLLSKQFSIWELLMTKKFLQISSNLFSLQFICFKQDLESFIGKEEHRFKAASAREILKLKIQNIIKLPGTWVDAISTISVWSIFGSFHWKLTRSNPAAQIPDFRTPKSGSVSVKTFKTGDFFRICWIFRVVWISCKNF